MQYDIGPQCCLGIGSPTGVTMVTLRLNLFVEYYGCKSHLWSIPFGYIDALYDGPSWSIAQSSLSNTLQYWWYNQSQYISLLNTLSCTTVKTFSGLHKRYCCSPENIYLQHKNVFHILSIWSTLNGRLGFVTLS